jgi:hypothetical protein
LQLSVSPESETTTAFGHILAGVFPRSPLFLVGFYAAISARNLGKYDSQFII